MIQLGTLACVDSPNTMHSQVNNVIDPFKYTEVPFGSKSELKDYLKVGEGYIHKTGQHARSESRREQPRMLSICVMERIMRWKEQGKFLVV